MISQESILAQFSTAYTSNEAGIVYFDNAGRSMQPLAVENAGQAALWCKSSPWLGLAGSGDADVVDLRTKYAQLMNADGPSAIAITPSTGFAMTMAVNNIVRLGLLKPNQEVLLLEKEMASVVYPWQHACQVTGAKIVTAPFPNWGSAEQATGWTEAILSLINANTAVLALPHVHWCDGSLIDLRIISMYLQQLPEDSRPLLIIDGTQSIGALPFDIQLIQPDFVACSVHKWLLSPYGMSLVYLHPRFRSTWQPLDQHERARLGSDQSWWDEEIPCTPDQAYPEVFFDGARRLDSGGRANPVLIPMVRAALDLLTTCWQPSNIHTQLTNYTEKLIDKLQVFEDFDSVFILPPKQHRGGHILGLRLHPTSGLSLTAVHQALKKHNVHCSIRGGALRLSPSLADGPLQINLFVSLLFQIIRQQLSQLLSAVPRQRVLITGASGWLAQFVCNHLLTKSELRSKLEVYGTYREGTTPPHWLLTSNQVVMDLTDTTSIHSVIDTIKPDVILHLAACSSPVECQKNPSLAMAINCPTTLVDAAKQVNPHILFLFASTDMVYDGEHPPYSANESSAAPINVYGDSKASMERYVMQHLQHGYILRLSNMLGPACIYRRIKGEKFLQWLSGAMKRKERIALKTDERRSFIAVDDVALVIDSLLTRYFSSNRDDLLLKMRVLNVGGPQSLSRMDVARSLCNVLNHRLIVANEDAGKELAAVEGENVWIVDTMTSSAGGSGPRSPLDITMVIDETEKALGITFTPIEEMLKVYLE